MSEAAAPNPRSRHAVRAAWVQRLERFAGAGLSVPAFCAAEGVSPPSFYAWKRRLQAGARHPDAALAHDGEPGPRWLPVRVGAATAVELVLPAGAVLRLAPGCDLAFVRCVVQALGGAPC